MDLLDLLRPEHVIVPLRADDVRDAVEQLEARLEETGAVARSEALHRRIRSEPIREVVAISEDVLLPHYRSDAVASLTLALGLTPAGIPSHEPGLDIRPRVVALVLAPLDAASFYLQATSTLARVLRSPGIIDRLVAQPDATAVLALPDLQDLRIQPSLAVRDVMTHRIHSVPPDATLRGTLDLMLRRRLQAVPVVGTKGEVMGIVTEADLMRTLLPKIPRAGSDDPHASDLADRPVRDVMTRSVLCVSEDLGVSEVASMMINKDVEQVPVVHAGTIAGMVSRADIIRKLFGRT